MIFNTDNEGILDSHREYEKYLDSLSKKHGSIKESSSLYIYAVNPKRVSGIYISSNIEKRYRVLDAIYQWTLLYKRNMPKALEKFLSEVDSFISNRTIGTPRHDNPIGVNVKLTEHVETLSNLLAYIELSYIGNLRLYKQIPNRPYIVDEDRNLKMYFEHVMSKMGKL